MDTSLKRNLPFTCYFCKNLIENDTQNGHMAVCGHVLEPCPNKCGSYIQRHMKNRHTKECMNNFKRSSVDLTENGTRNKGKYSTLDRIPNNSLQTREAGQIYSNTQIELTKICNRLQNLEQNVTQISNNFQLQNKKQLDEIAALRNAYLQYRTFVEKAQYQNQIIIEWKKHAETLFDTLKQQVNSLEKLKNENDLHWMNMQSKLMTLDQFNLDLAQINDNFVKEQVYSREVQNDMKEKLSELKDFSAQENATIGALWNDHKFQLDNLTEYIKVVSKSAEEVKLKYNALVFDVRTVNQISEETSEKVDVFEKQILNIRSDLAQLRSDVRAIEDGNTQQTFDSPGRCLWKISDFTSKMKQARDDGIILKSPAFYTHEYGYRIRLLVYLNGLKKWKGRHILAGLHVLKGEYDLLQKWPCNIEGEVILRDLQDSNDKRNIVKRIVAKRLCGDEENEEPDDSSTQYIFIPHSTIMKENYIKSDTLFLEIKIMQRYGLETML